MSRSRAVDGARRRSTRRALITTIGRHWSETKVQLAPEFLDQLRARLPDGERLNREQQSLKLVECRSIAVFRWCGVSENKPLRAVAFGVPERT